MFSRFQKAAKTASQEFQDKVDFYRMHMK
uniref:Uncharacterized protein n=1 Tax=Anguilla anguilla TaxID=7936 RepID=A0A0E9QQ01_ANGAN